MVPVELGEAERTLQDSLWALCGSVLADYSLLDDEAWLLPIASAALLLNRPAGLAAGQIHLLVDIRSVPQ